MTNEELDRLLHSSKVPDLPKEYWDEFNMRVMQEARQRQSRQSRSTVHLPKSRPKIYGFSAPLRLLFARPALIFGVAIFSAVLAFVASSYLRNETTGLKPLKGD